MLVTPSLVYLVPLVRYKTVHLLSLNTIKNSHVIVSYLFLCPLWCMLSALNVPKTAGHWVQV